MATLFVLHDPYESRGTIAAVHAADRDRASSRAGGWPGGSSATCAAAATTRATRVIVGTGRVARKTARALRHASWMGIKNIGFVEDQPSRWTSDLDILGTLRRPAAS